MDFSSQGNSPIADKGKGKEVQKVEELIDYMIWHKDILRANISRFNIHSVEVPREALHLTCSIFPSKLKNLLSSYRLFPPHVTNPGIDNARTNVPKKGEIGIYLSFFASGLRFPIGSDLVKTWNTITSLHANIFLLLSGVLWPFCLFFAC